MSEERQSKFGGKAHLTDLSSIKCLDVSMSGQEDDPFQDKTWTFNVVFIPHLSSSRKIYSRIFDSKDKTDMNAWLDWV